MNEKNLHLIQLIHKKYTNAFHSFFTVFDERQHNCWHWGRNAPPKVGTQLSNKGWLGGCFCTHPQHTKSCVLGAVSHWLRGD
jgi:hypothetical protein